MSRTHIVALLLATLAAFLPPLAPVAAASPCAAPCGEVVIVTDCLTGTINAEGTTTLSGVTWSFIARETDGWVTTTYTPSDQTGSAAAFSVPVTRQSTWYPWYLSGELYADGELVASGSSWCPGIH